MTRSRKVLERLKGMNSHTAPEKHCQDWLDLDICSYLSKHQWFVFCLFFQLIRNKIGL